MDEEEGRRDWRKKKKGRSSRVARRNALLLAICCLGLCFVCLLFVNQQSRINKGMRIGLIASGERGSLEEAVIGGLSLTSGIHKLHKIVFKENFTDIEPFMLSEGIDFYLVEPNTDEFCLALTRLHKKPPFLTVKIPSKKCSTILTYTEGPLEPHYSLLASRLAGKSDVIAIIREEEFWLKDLIIKSFDKYNIKVILHKIGFRNETEELSTVLKDFSKFPVIFSSGEAFFRAIKNLEETKLLHNRLVMAHTSEREKLSIIHDPFYRNAAENVALVTTSLKYPDPRWPSSENLTEINQYLKKLSGWRILSGSHQQQQQQKIGIDLDLLRIIPRSLLSTKFLQLYPWWLEGKAHFKPIDTFPGFDSNNLKPLQCPPDCRDERWILESFRHSPSNIVQKNDIFGDYKKNCSDAVVYIKVKDPFLKRKLEKIWNENKFPLAVAIPNSGDGSFQIKIFCRKQNESTDVEIGCENAPAMTRSNKCIHAQKDARGRRVIRSFSKRQEFRIPEDHLDEDIKKRLVKDEFKSILPAIAGCVGATSGCSFCYLYLMYVPVDVNPGVCYGACAVAVGGSCSSLIARGVQGKYDSTVICTELFRQGYLSLDSLMADERYGSKLQSQNPLVMHGYRTAAEPLVQMMRKFPSSSRIVHKVALPWIRHMEYVEHETDQEDYYGVALTCVGYCICFVIGSFTCNFRLIIISVISAFMIMKAVYR